MDLNEAVEKTIIECYLHSRRKCRDDFLLVEIKKNVPTFDDDIEQIEVVMITFEKALEYLNEWKAGRILFDGITFNDEGLGNRVRYLV